MPPTLTLPDIRSTLADFRRRIEILERRIRPQAATAAATAAGVGVGSFVMFRHDESVASTGIPGDAGFSGFTRVAFVSGDVFYSEATEDFWTVNGDNTISYTTGIYAVVTAVNFDPPGGSTGKNIVWDSAGLPHYQTLTSDMAGVSSTISFGAGAEVIVVHFDGEVSFFGGQEFRITHNLGATVTIGASMFVTKIATL